MKEKVKKIIKTVGYIFVALQVIKSILVTILVISTLIKDRKDRQNKELEDNKGRA
jgi:Na+/serine symporter